jgi:hypothetical protein
MAALGLSAVQVSSPTKAQTNEQWLTVDSWVYCLETRRDQMYRGSNHLYSVVRSSTVSDRIGYLIHVLIYNTYLVWKSDRRLHLPP